jgi:hypothetical protein
MRISFTRDIQSKSLRKSHLNVFLKFFLTSGGWISTKGKKPNEFKKNTGIDGESDGFEVPTIIGVKLGSEIVHCRELFQEGVDPKELEEGK